MANQPDLRHRLRAVLGRLQLELELMLLRGVAVQNVLDSVREAIEMLDDDEQPTHYVRLRAAAATKEVIVVDDDPLTAKSIASALHENGIDATTATADELMSSARPSATVLADLSAIDAFGHDDLWQSHRLIVMTGADRAYGLKRATQLNADSVAWKPLSSDNLQQIMEGVRGADES